MAGQKIRIRLKSYDHEVIDSSARKIVETVKGAGATVVGPVPLPTEKNVYCVIRSPHKYKDSREHFEMRTHKRLIDVVDPVMTRAFATNAWTEVWASEDAAKRGGKSYIMEKEDVQTQLRAITEKGREFSGVLSRAQQSFASELRETRNQWAHGHQFSSDDTARALDTIERLLRAVDAVDSADDVRKLRLDLQRTVYEEQKRKQAKRVEHIAIEGDGMKPWREVIRPHEDVARGEFTASEFAADLHTVHAGLASGTEYADPVEFFSRTYITDGLRDLLTSEALVDGVLLLARQLRQEPPDRVEAGTAGGVGHDLVEALTHAMIAGEGAPHRLHDCRGVHECAVHVAQDRLGPGQEHRSPGGTARRRPQLNGHDASWSRIDEMNGVSLSKDIVNLSRRHRIQ